MKAIITPANIVGKPISGEVKLPPSKSMSHRAIICACLASGTSLIKNIAFSKDIIATIDGMRKLGADIVENNDSVEIKGIGKLHNIENDVIMCNESGSTLRFLIPIFSLVNQKIVFSGSERLMERPQTVYADIFAKQRLCFTQSSNSILIEGSLKGCEYELEGDVSSQFVSGLLFALPLIDKTSIIHIKPPFQSRSYVMLTIQVMRCFGVTASFIDEDTIIIEGNQQYKSCDYAVEGDYSQLAFFAVLGIINGDISCTGLNHCSLQGDKVIMDFVKNCAETASSPAYRAIENGYCFNKSLALKGDEIDLSDCPDLGPILMIMAMFSCEKGNNITKIYNAGRLRLKESDRIAAMETELLKLGVSIKTTQDEVVIAGKSRYNGCKTLQSHNDHRIAMSLAVAAVCGDSVSIIDNAECINKSYPNFFNDMKKLGVSVDLVD